MEKVFKINCSRLLHNCPVTQENRYTLSCFTFRGPCMIKPMKPRSRERDNKSATNESSDHTQSGHPPGLIGVVALHLIKNSVLSMPSTFSQKQITHDDMTFILMRLADGLITICQADHRLRCQHNRACGFDHLV